MKLQHRSGLFVSNDGNEYYLEYTKDPYKLICKYLQDYPDVDITNDWSKRPFENYIKVGNWVEFSLDLISGTTLPNNLKNAEEN